MRWAAAGALAAVLLAGGVPRPAEAESGPRRVVSINLCTDQLAVLLLPRERIAALSFLARDADLSAVAEAARELPTTHGMAEEILPLKPDLVLAGTFTTRATVRLLKAQGVPVLEIGIASGFEEIRQQVRQVAAALGETKRGEAILSAMDGKLAAARAGDRQRPSALTFAPGGFTAGAGTLSDAVLTAAGFRNRAAAAGLSGYGYLSVEALVRSPPDLLLAGDGAEARPSLAGRLLAHPALARLIPPERRARLPGALLTCGGPFTAEAVTQLAEIRTRLVRTSIGRDAKGTSP